MRYSSYLLRLQWMQNGDAPTWVTSIQSTQSGEFRSFPNLNAFIQFLQGEFGDTDSTCTGTSEAGNEIPAEKV